MEKQVKPMRQERNADGGFKKRKPLPQLWWIYADKRPRLYRTIKPLDKVLTIALTSKSVQPCLVAADQVFAHSLGIFGYDDYFHFGVLTSGFHYRWAVRHSSSLETRVRYTPSDVFETFPQPPYSADVEEVGKTLDEHRSQLMRSREVGLTSVYNLVHNPDVRSDDEVKRLRELHVELDLAVRNAYGWSDLDMQHGFHPVRSQGVRFTFSPWAAGEVLDRLLALNEERYEAEVAAGLHEAKKPKKPRASKAVSAGQGLLLGDEQ